MNFFGQLFDGDWRAFGDSASQARQSQHFQSMPEQVMGNRTEIQFLQGEIDRVSQDLARAMLLNRTLVKLMLSEKVCDSERLEKLLVETMAESEPSEEPGVRLSKFCVDCGRPLPQPGKACPYCTEIAFQPVPEPAKKKSKKKAKSKAKKKKAKKKAKATKVNEDQT